MAGQVSGEHIKVIEACVEAIDPVPAEESRVRRWVEMAYDSSERAGY